MPFKDKDKSRAWHRTYMKARRKKPGMREKDNQYLRDWRAKQKTAKTTRTTKKDLEIKPQFKGFNAVMVAFQRTPEEIIAKRQELIGARNLNGTIYEKSS